MSNIKDQLAQKFANQEISKEEYEDLLSKLDSLDLLQSQEKQNYDVLSVHGKRTLTNCTADKVRVSGKLTIHENLVANDLSVAGIVSVANNLTVLNSARVNGKLLVNGEAKIAKSSKIAGKMEIGTNLFASEKLSIAGKITVQQDITSDGDLKVAGKLRSRSIRSAGTISIGGKIHVDENVVANFFIVNNSTGFIGGNLFADTVTINQRHRESSVLDDESETITDLPSLARFLTRVIRNTNFSYNSPSAPFVVNGNIESVTADLSNIEIGGDLVADNVILGPNVVVKGIVKYRETISYPEDLEIAVEKINS